MLMTNVLEVLLKDMLPVSLIMDELALLNGVLLGTTKVLINNELET